MLAEDFHKSAEGFMEKNASENGFLSWVWKAMDLLTECEFMTLLNESTIAE